MEVLGASTLEIPGTGAYGHTQTISVHQSVSVCPHTSALRAPWRA